MAYRTNNLFKPAKEDRRMKNKRKKAGFSMMELMVALSLGSILLSGTVSSVYQVTSSVAESNNRVFENSKARLLIDRFYVEARAASDVHSTTETTFEFTYKDHSGSSNRVRYSWDALNNQLTKTNVNTGAATTVSLDLSDVDFDYFDKYGDEVYTENVTNINVNAVQVSFKQTYDQKESILESPVIMFRNKTLI